MRSRHFAPPPPRHWRLVSSCAPTRIGLGYGLARALRMLLDVLAGLSALEETRTEKGQLLVHGELAPAMMRVDPTGTARLIPLAPWHWSAPGTLPTPERHGHLAPERLLGGRDRRASGCVQRRDTAVGSACRASLVRDRFGRRHRHAPHGPESGLAGIAPGVELGGAVESRRDVRAVSRSGAAICQLRRVGGSDQSGRRRSRGDARGGG